MNESAVNELTAYLKAPVFPKAVEQLAQTGISRYRSSKLARRSREVGAGRREEWIKDTFGNNEDKLIKSLSKEASPPTWTVDCINSTYEYWEKKQPPLLSDTLPTMTMVKGVGVNFLHEMPLGENCLLQLASQFNFLESPNNRIAPVYMYLYDTTQVPYILFRSIHAKGPQGSIEAAAASLHRTAAVKAEKLPHALTALLPSNHKRYYQNGYLELFKVMDSQLEPIFDHVKERVGEMRVLAQWVLCEASGRIQLQVFSAAPSYQRAGGRPEESSIGAEFCRFIVGTQYEVLGKLAVIRSQITEQNVPVHLTLVGQGAFQNPLSALKVALKRLADAIRGYPRVHVYIHAYGEADQLKVRKALDASSFAFREMSESEFKHASLST